MKVGIDLSTFDRLLTEKVPGNHHCNHLVPLLCFDVLGLAAAWPWDKRWAIAGVACRLCARH